VGSSGCCVVRGGEKWVMIEWGIGGGGIRGSGGGICTLVSPFVQYR
jgi:hypothetical protein